MTTEENYKYQKLGLIVLAKALDDICPTFNGEAKEDKAFKIKERIKTFKLTETELDDEWRQLEKEATEEVKNFEKEKSSLISKIQRTKNTNKVRLKVSDFEIKKSERVNYLLRKLDRESQSLKAKLEVLDTNSKKYKQLASKLDRLQITTDEKIRKSESRFNTIIKNTMNSDNTEKIAKRLLISEEVWQRKYKELEEKHLLKESIHNNRRMELDQIRIAVDGFVNETDSIKHWCLVSGVTLKDCYKEVARRLDLINRDNSVIIEILEKIRMGEF